MYRHRRPHMGLLLLAAEVYELGLDHIPPVTLGVLALNVFLFLFPVADPWETCVSVQQVFSSGEWRRLVLAPVHHVDDWHLYFNMVSFLWKGTKLERRLGRNWFLYLLVVFSLLTDLLYLALEALLAELTQDPSYNTTCAVGFSGVLFALKVLNNHYNPGGVTILFGAVPVSNRYASWAELILIYVIAPESSFVGHLAGILAGLLYTSGPLKSIMKRCADFVSSNGGTFYPSRTYTYHSGTTGYRDAAGGNAPNDRSADSAAYTGGLTEEEQLQEAIRNSLNNGDQTRTGGAPPPAGFNVSAETSADEVRWRRLRRFDR